MSRLYKLIDYLEECREDFEILKKDYSHIRVFSANVEVSEKLDMVFVHNFPYLWRQDDGKLEKESLELLRKIRDFIHFVGEITNGPVYFSLSRENKHWYRLGFYKEFELIFKGKNPHSGNIIRVYKYEKKENK